MGDDTKMKKLLRKKYGGGLAFGWKKDEKADAFAASS